MQRYRNNAVTAIPILIPCSRDEQQGEATFDQFTGPVREVTGEDFSTKTGRHRKFLDSMREDERQHFAAVVSLLNAIEKRDRTAADKARKQLSELRAARPSEVDGEFDRQFGGLIAPYYGLPPEQAEKAWEIWHGRRLPPRIAGDEAKILSYEISEKLALGVSPVFWWTGRKFTPALFCSDPRLALYVYILTRKRWGVCPHCGTFFEQQRRDQSYCCIAHREAHRVARWRADQKAKRSKLNSGKSKRKAGKHGSQKTR
jgi:hypothetical protein